ncbi:hypothetical protein BH09PAT2_BH09PAT2_05510 [soil metagenome]
MEYTLDLYLPEKYRVFPGAQTNVALCTCWADPTLLIAKYQNLLKQFAITSTLYSREGVSVMLRNLCLNPTIDTVVIWANNPLSNTAIGSAGRTALTKLWENGITDDHTIRGAGVKIHKEIVPAVIENVRRNVKIVDMSRKSFDEVLIYAEKMKNSQLQTYMEPLSFAEPVREKLTTMPSEKVGWNVRGKSTTDAWIRAIDKVLRYGDIKKTESGSNQKELQSVTWTIQNECIDHFAMPEWPSAVKEHVGLNEEMLTQYKQIFLTADKPKDSAYTYGNRLYDYPGNINQIEQVIEKIKKEHETRRAYATTFYPPTDHTLASPPCLTSVQFLTTIDNTLNMFASFRSHDMFKAALPNAFGLLHLQKYVSDKTTLKPGSLSITSFSAHIYEEDWQMAQDTLKCALWERTKLYFDENEDIDPRGMMRIAVRGDRIHIEMVTDSGDQLFEYVGKSAREVALKIARLELLSLVSHYVDITIELTKAEVAMKSGLKYIQDKALILNGKAIK